jgi:hypothetical protein
MDWRKEMTKPNAPTEAVQFYWLVELFHRGGNSLGRYHTGFTDLTYVDRKKVRSSNPGFCFLAAGWRRCGTTRSGLEVLERESDAADV